MVSCKSSVRWLLLTASAVHCDEVNDDVRERKIPCYRGEAILLRGRSVLISSPNANASCGSVDITTLPDGEPFAVNITNGKDQCTTYPMEYVSLPANISKTATEASLLWRCDEGEFYCVKVGIADPSDTVAAPISTPSISQTCIIEPKSPTGTGGAPRPTGTAGTLPIGSSAAATTPGTAPMGPPTTQGDGTLPTTTLPSGPIITGGATTSGGIVATTSLPGGPDVTGRSSQGGAAMPTMTGAFTAPGQNTMPPTDDPNPTNPSGTLIHGSATGPMGVPPPTSTANHADSPCTCQAG